MIKTIKIFQNGTQLSASTEELLKRKLIINGFSVVEGEKSADLIVSIGGDGRFLQTLRETNFDIGPLYVGILSGHLGFLQEINLDQIDEFISSIKNESYKVEKLSIQNACIYTENSKHKFHALNETVIREKNLKVLHLNLDIDNNFVEKFSGDGIIVATPIGSTAYNLSLGGSIVYPSLNILQITPLAPINSQTYRSLRNSIIVPPEMTISLIPVMEYSSDVLISVDGYSEKICNVKKIEINTGNAHIKTLRFENYSFWTRIQEKFL